MHILTTSEPDAYAGRVSPISTTAPLAHPTPHLPPPFPPFPPPRNDASGAIYGKLTSGSMQKAEDAMISHCGLGKDSVFIDGGADLGKHPGGPVPWHSDLFRHRV
ncbi:hypothetical protein NSK_008466 [Nannochloropsis salina CCMP1776]|uniref:Uncharacterized protein n=1 Tax=Nannochloropsis salina CCMP1776 TaxID=1027361 RepID=A0A4D9CM63_9STRA|nr:hypothetical protein NSK_008466 [Nannochloropsis salina CCMP1776]|eukprot:TFJ80200.1 hypothetical protein NSK_008466 [Nannochloropsis salina CCMP1776]